ncbi:sugar lactone lactonase YvrE [Deinococcus budaensis]|uniref:Sugar lactone lactonase YvrE n=1 Tax=Deinococcus budaensis TaxID=1665626 RepID=A0A7W8LR35_9DEIO|nr:ScyD/ScyE family protein [Deinococcus budaensis]MBB5235476.1 sugar lactone lactonase YvrE [Deinococcus budaensis]
MHKEASRNLIRLPLTALVSAGLLLGCASLPLPHTQAGPPRVVATGLNGPQGVHVGSDGTLWVTDDGLGGETPFDVPSPQGNAEGNYGPTARVVRVAPDGTQTVVANTPSIFIPGIGPTGGGKIAVIGSNVYVANGVWNAGFSIARPAGASAVLRIDGAAATEVANVFAFEAATNPDGVPAEQGGIDSHAYGLGAGPDGQLYVADAGANALFKVDPGSGAVSLVASLAGRTGTGAQSVPTGVAFGQDGAAYVSLLSGGPFPSGAARVVKVSGGTVSDFATGMTMLTDVERGPDGNLYAVSFGRFAPAPGGSPFVPNAGSVIRLKAGGVKETVLSGLNYPTSLAFNAAGDAYVAENGVGAPGSGRVVRYSGLTRYPAE